MATILNLTQHNPTETQEALGVGSPLEGAKELLTFTTLPTEGDILGRAAKLASLVAEKGNQGDEVMVGGAPYLMPALCANLKELGFIPVFSFTERRSVETVKPDGTVLKTAVFEHCGWVKA